MRPPSPLLALLLSLGLAIGGDAAAAPPPDRRIALTVDDLPWVPLPSIATADALPGHRRLVAAIAGAGVPVVGFVNEGKLEDRGQIDPQRLQMLRDWLDAGAELGNHSYGHSDLHAVGLEAYHLSLNGQAAPVLDGTTGDQRFFYGWAQVWQSKYRDEALKQQVATDPHSPAQFRVIGPLRNVDAWYDAFDVEPGAKYYLAPEDRVRIW